MNRKIIAVIAASSLLLAACNKQDIGGLSGAALGGLAGAQIGKGKGSMAMAAVGALGGYLVGGAIGKSMDDTDRLKANQALETAPTGDRVAWRNPDTGGSYAVTPTNTYETASGPCREYTTEATIDGRQETVYGTACRQPDGTWQSVK